MRILWLSHLVPYPPKGGVQQRSYNLIRELGKHHEVVVLPFYQQAHQRSEQDLAEATDHFSDFCKFEKPIPIPSETTRFGRHLLALKSLFNKPYTVNWLDSTVYALAFGELVGRFAPDLIHFDTISLVPYAFASLNVPLSLNHHNIESDMLCRRAQHEKNPLAKLYYLQEGSRLRRYERNIANRFSVHLTCSELDSRRLVAIAGNVTTEVIANGVDLEYFRPSVPRPLAPDNSMIFAGRMSWYPNAAAMKFFVDDIWPLLKRKLPGSQMTIVGKSPPSELTKAAAEDKQLRVTGFVDDVRPYIENAAIYVCPIFDGGGTKLKIVDALAMGCAIVAHPIACEGINVTNEVNLLLAETPQEFVVQIERLARDAKLRRTLGEAARKLAEEQYSFAMIGSKLARCYEALVKHKIESRPA